MCVSGCNAWDSDCDAGAESGCALEGLSKRSRKSRAWDMRMMSGEGKFGHTDPRVVEGAAQDEKRSRG